MAQKIVGYREMVWTCPNCGAKNPGSVRICRSCGAAMGEEVQFEQQTNAGMTTDEKVIEKAQRGPDIYCAYCGNRNPAGAETCSRCGADLSEGKERQHGTQHSAHLDEHAQAEKIICPACGTENPAGTLKCRTCGSPLTDSGTAKEEIPAVQDAPVKNQGGGRGCLFIIIILVLFGILALVLFGGGSNSNNVGIFSPGVQYTPVPNQVLNAVVSSQNWRTGVQVIGPVDSKASGWRDSLPSDARNIRCQDRLYRTYDEEVSGSVEVCGTPYAIDMGNGFEQFVQDCVYEVYRSYCDYTVSKSGVSDTVYASGSGPNPELPYIESKYQSGSQSASYTVVLRDENGREYTLNPSTLSEYRSYTVGTEFMIEVNSRGRIVNMEQK